MTKKQLNPSWRARKIYWATFVISIDYFWLFLRSKFFGKSYFEKRASKLHIRSAYRLRKVFTELQGLFIKIGQLISILSTFLPEEFRKPLEDFQDKAPARPFEEIQKNVEDELGAPISVFFKKIEETPIASASIGQVHRATLLSGEVAAIKVQHEHIPLVAEVDLRLFENVNSFAARIFKIKGMEAVAGEVRLMILEELDYGQEAENMELMRESLSDSPRVVVPEIFEDLCTPRLLVSKFCEGVKINNIAQIDNWEIDRDELAKDILELSCKMVLKDGLYHADPHPGNILINKEGKMIWLDFGAVASLNPRMKSGMAKLIEAVARQDSEEIVESLKYMGFVGRGNNARKFAEKALEQIQDFVQSEIKMDGLNFKDIEFDPTTADYSKILSIIDFKEIANTFQVPKDYILLNRMMILILGLSTELAPRLNPLDVVRPYIRNMMVRDRQQLATFITDTVRSNLTNLLTLPGEMSKVLHKVKRGELEMTIKSFDDRTNAFYFLGQQFLFALLTLGLGAFSYLAYFDGLESIFRWAMFGVVVTLILLLRALYLAGRYRKRL